MGHLKGFLLELLAGIVSLALWLLGWPSLATVSYALNVLGLILTAVAVAFGIFLLAAIVQSQRQPPYGS
jgi:type IV secretory pathway TrbL component